MQTALLHLLPAPGPATSAHAGAPVSSVVPAGAPPDFGAALSHAASDMSATGAANEDAAASPLRRRAGARAEPVRGQGRDGHPQASAAATREQTLAGGPRPSDAADSLQASDQEAEPAAASEKAFDEHAGVALSPWLAALVGAASAPAATPASGPTSGLDPAKAAAATRQASVDGSAARQPKGASSADASVSTPGAAQHAAAAHGAVDRLRSAPGRPPADATSGMLREAGPAPAAPSTAARAESTLARASGATRSKAAPVSGTPGTADRSLTVQVAGEKVRVELGPRDAADTAGRRPAATAQALAQRVPARIEADDTAATVQGPSADTTSVAGPSVAAEAAATSRSAAQAADGPRDLARTRAADSGAPQPRLPQAAEVERRPSGAAAKAADASSAAALPSAPGLVATRRDTPDRGVEDARDGERLRPSPADGAAAGDAAPRRRLRDSLHAPEAAGSLPVRGPADGVAVTAGRGNTVERADLDPRQTPIRPQARVQDRADTAHADAASQRSAAARSSHAPDVDPAGTIAPRRTPAASASEAVSAVRVQDPTGPTMPPMESSAATARRPATAAPGTEAARVPAADRANTQPGPSRAEAGRWRAGHPGSAVAGTARGRIDGAAEGTDSAAAADASTPTARSNSAAAAPPSSPPGASSTAAAPALAATAAPTAMPVQAGAAAVEPNRRPALLQGTADQAGGAVRLGAGAGAGAEPGRMKRGPAGTDADPTLRRSAPDAATPTGETQAAAWMRALEAAVSSPVDREVRADAPSLAGTASPSVQETGFSASRATGAAQEASASAARIEAALNSPEFAPMLGVRIAALVRDGIEQARIALNPQEMGPVSVQLALDGSKVSVELAAEVEATRVALEQALPTLAGALHEAGFTLAGGGVFQQSRDSGGAASQQDQAWDAREAEPRIGRAQAAAAPAAAARTSRSQGLVDLYA